MKILGVSNHGVIKVAACVREGVFITISPVEFAFDDGCYMKVPRGFIFDGASIPPEARSFFPHLTPAAHALFLGHDYPYAKGATWINEVGERVSFTRDRADDIAVAICGYLGLDAYEQFMIHGALRVFGEPNFQRFPVDRTIEMAPDLV